MKPSIVYWGCGGLAYVILSNALIIKDAPENFPWYSFILPAIMIVISIIAIVGLLKAVPWSRIVAPAVIGAEIFGTLITSMFLYFDADGYRMNVLISILAFNTPLLILAYKLFSSEVLKGYLDI